MVTNDMENMTAVRKNQTRVLAGLGAEVCFALLPLIVLVVVSLAIGENKTRLVTSPEWSFGASILFGQALVKFVSGLARRGKAATGPVALALALLLVIGLVPSLIVLTLILASEGGGETRMWLSISQLALFCVSALSYMVFGTLGEMWDKT